MLSIGKNSQEMRKANRALVLEILHAQSPISRSEIAEITGLTRATVTNIIKEFFELGLVEEVKTVSTSVGRKKRLLNVRSDAFYVAGVDLSRYKIRVGVFNTVAEIISMDEVNTPADAGKEEVLKLLHEVLTLVISRSRIRREKLYGIGLGIPGPLDYERGIVISPPKFGSFENVPLRDILERDFKVSIWIDNDANVAAIGEKWFGYGKKLSLSNFVFVLADIGFGCGIIIDRKLYRGSLKGAGEVGHIPVILGDNVRELEDLASLSNLPLLYKKRTGKHLEIDDLIDHSRSGKREASEVLKEVGRYISLGVGTLVNILSPEMVIIGGRFAKFPGAISTVREVVEQFTFSTDRPQIELTALNDKAIVLGAAALALEELVSDPYRLILSGGRKTP